MKLRHWLVLTALMIFLLLPSAALSQPQLVFVDVNRVLQDSAQGQAEASRLNNLIATRQNEISAQRDTLTNLQKQLQEGLTLSQEEINDLQKKIQAKNTQIERMRQDAQSELNAEQNLVLTRLSENLRSLVTDLAKERGYGAVFMRSVDRQLFVRDMLDITPEVIQLYDERFPATK